MGVCCSRGKAKRLEIIGRILWEIYTRIGSIRGSLQSIESMMRKDNHLTLINMDSQFVENLVLVRSMVLFVVNGTGFLVEEMVLV